MWIIVVATVKNADAENKILVVFFLDLRHARIFGLTFLYTFDVVLSSVRCHMVPDVEYF